MTQESLERPLRSWTFKTSARGTRKPDAAARQTTSPPLTPTDIADPLIELAGRLQIAETRAW